jgi:hypothetical protein
MLYLENNCFAVFLTHSLKSGYENSSFALFLANNLKNGNVGRKFIYFSLEMQDRKSHIFVVNHAKNSKQNCFFNNTDEMFWVGLTL